MSTNVVSLTDALAAYAKHLEANRPKTARAYANLVKRLVAADAGKAAPKVGDVLPRFLLPDENGRLTDLDELIAAGPLVVSLNRGHWCGFCRYELQSLQAIHEMIVARGGNVVAITPERQAFAKELKTRCSLGFPVLCDIDNGYALSLGLAVWCGEEVKSVYAEIGFDLPEFQGNSSWVVPVPATYVLGADGHVKVGFVSADFRRRLSPDDILSALS